MRTIKEIFIPGDYLVTKGERFPGVESLYAALIADGVIRPTKTTSIWPNYTLDRTRDYLSAAGERVIGTQKPFLWNTSGIADKVTWWETFRINSDLLRLAEIKQAFEQGNSVPIVVEYWTAFADCLRLTPKKLFEELHGVETEDQLLQIPFEEAQKIGWKASEEGKKAKYPDWTYAVYVNGERIELMPLVARIPYKRGPGCFIATAMSGYLFSEAYSWTVIGARGGDSVAANAILENRPAVILPKVSDGLLYIEGVEEFHNLLMQQVMEAARNATKKGITVTGLEFFGITDLDKVGPQTGWPRKVKCYDNLEGLDFWLKLGERWLSGEDLDDQGYL